MNARHETSVKDPMRAQPRSVRLLNRHWAWLDAQSTSASAAVRLLVEEARRDRDGRYRSAQAKDACYFYMRDMAGDRPHFEEAVRALFANDGMKLRCHIASWPEQVRAHIAHLLGPAWFGDDNTGMP
ncbi:DUF2239 family protein [Dyella sp. C11]|uniref:DUF2239 family protein n=1 Tax=Dyella sp. C11 TaxID=2126991 RepID=UPI000D65962A|nr:DUF2239 family protein [Dyella sp. C11]